MTIKPTCVPIVNPSYSVIVDRLTKEVTVTYRIEPTQTGTGLYVRAVDLPSTGRQVMRPPRPSYFSDTSGAAAPPPAE